MKSTGIVLLAFGSKGYPYAAYNLAYSIKFYNPDLHITLIHDESIKYLTESDLSYFDNFISVTPDYYTSAGKFDPAKAKLNLYSLLPYDNNLYVDVDSLSLTDLQQLIDRFTQLGYKYLTHIMGTHTLSQGDVIDSMLWANAGVIWEKYGLQDTAVLPAVNSSFQWIVKGEEAEKIFSTALDCYADPIPLDSLRNKWGGAQPDELYINIALAKLGLNPAAPFDVMFFGDKISGKPMTRIQQEYYFLSIYGGKNWTRPVYTEWYDRKLTDLHKKKNQKHRYKYPVLLQDKHSNNTKNKKTIIREPRQSFLKSVPHFLLLND